MKRISLFLLLSLFSAELPAGQVRPLLPAAKKAAGKVLVQQPSNEIDCSKITCITVTEDVLPDCPSPVLGSDLEPVEQTGSVFDQAL